MVNEQRESGLAGIGLMTALIEHRYDPDFLAERLESIRTEEGYAGICNCLVSLVNVAAVAVSSLAQHTKQTQLAALQMLAQRLVDMPDSDTTPH